MNKLIAVLLMAVMLCGCSKKVADPYADKEPDLRNVNWGMTFEQVKARETTEPENSISNDMAEMLFYKTTLNDRECELKYSFKTSKDSGSETRTLYRAEYTMPTTDLKDYDVMNLYADLRKQLMDKYGNDVTDYLLISDSNGLQYDKISDLYEKMTFGHYKDGDFEMSSTCSSQINTNKLKIKIQIEFNESGHDESITITYSPIEVSDNL